MLRGFTKGLTRLALAAALLCAALGASASARGARAECPMSRMHGCCKRARQNRDAHGLMPARLCCVTNFPQPAPTGANYTARQSPGAASDPRPPAAPAPAAHAAPRTRAHAQPSRPSHSPPAYIQHAAFLI